MSSSNIRTNGKDVCTYIPIIYLIAEGLEDSIAVFENEVAFVGRYGIYTVIIRRFRKIFRVKRECIFVIIIWAIVTNISGNPIKFPRAQVVCCVPALLQPIDLS